MKNKFTIKETEIHKRSSGKIPGLPIKVKALDYGRKFNEEKDVVQRNINKTCFLNITIISFHLFFCFDIFVDSYSKKFLYRILW